VGSSVLLLETLSIFGIDIHNIEYLIRFLNIDIGFCNSSKPATRAMKLSNFKNLQNLILMTRIRGFSP